MSGYSTLIFDRKRECVREERILEREITWE